MQAEAKQVTQCDHCKMTLDPKMDVDKENIQAKLNNSKGEGVTYHACNEACLLGFLQTRAERSKNKKKKKSRASVIVDGVEFDF